MARYRKNSPFFDKSMRILAGSACFADIAVAIGCIWNLTKLEDLLDPDRDGVTGMYRKMLDDGVVPKPDTCKRIQSRLDDITPLGKQKANLLYWRDNSLWILLSNHLIDSKKYKQLLDVAWDTKDEKYLQTNEVFINDPENIFRELTWSPGNIFGNNGFESVESLILYTARLRKAIDNNLLPLVCRYTYITHYLLDKLIYKIPQLYIRWPLLIKLYKDNLWPMEISEFKIKNELDITLRYMDYSRPGSSGYSALYPPMQLHRNVNNEFLKSIYAQ